MASLRAPRVAIVIPTEGWTLHARRGLEFFSRIWGGASGVIVPTGDDGVHAAVERLLKRYDPDYVTNLQMTLSDLETLRPGWYPLEVDNEAVPAADREEFIRRFETNGPQTVGQVVQDDVIDAIAASLPCFREDDGERRLLWVHPSHVPETPLVNVTLEPEQQLQLESGDSFIDLALGLHTGLTADPTTWRKISDNTLSRHEAAAVLTKDMSHVFSSPFDATRVGLTTITHGYMRRLRPLVVLGRTANDMALAMLWNRLVGSGTWLPVSGSQTRWHPDIGSALDLARLAAAERKLLITSVSLSEDRCQDLMRRFWAARYVFDPNDHGEPWNYALPTDLDTQGRVDLRLNDKWDERFAAPANVHDDGSAEMATTFPLLVPDGLPDDLSGWVVDVDWPEHPIHAHHSVIGAALVAKDQSQHETFVRAAGTGITFESGRWDLVLSGASRFGQLAQPKLRWPGLVNLLGMIAGSAGYGVQPSHAGKVGRIAADLWAGREYLADDLIGERGQLLRALVSPAAPNGPIDDGKNITDEDRRLMMQGACLAPFHALTRMAGQTMTLIQVREWLDDRVESGAVRMGLILNCGVCPWVDFYQLDNVGQRFQCNRCGSENAVTHERWRSPQEAPRWYYDLHPTVREFLDQNGDVPVLAVRQFSGRRRAYDAAFELELVKHGAHKPTTEIDFAFMTRDGLVLGEAKRPGTLDGQNEKERVKDAGKLIEAARILSAREICFASATTWTDAARTAIAEAVEKSRTKVTVSLIERLAEVEASPRTILFNPGGP